MFKHNFQQYCKFYSTNSAQPAVVKRKYVAIIIQLKIKDFAAMSSYIAAKLKEAKLS